MNHTMMRSAALLLTVAAAACSQQEATPKATPQAAPAKTEPVAVETPANLPEDHHLASLKLPLFSKDAEERYMQLRRERAAAGRPESELVETIDFAKTLDEAFERATKEDKPVLLITQVRENGKLDCDV